MQVFFDSVALGNLKKTNSQNPTAPLFSIIARELELVPDSIAFIKSVTVLTWFSDNGSIVFSKICQEVHQQENMNLMALSIIYLELKTPMGKIAASNMIFRHCTHVKSF